jgi:hypothetical protein
MEISDFRILAYLHDAMLLGVKYDASKKDRRSVALDVLCHAEAGYKDWAGKHIHIQLVDVLLFDHFVFGCVTSDEKIDSWQTHLSVRMDAEARRIEKSGMSCSGHRFTITFHTGSYMEGICRSIIIEPKAE